MKCICEICCCGKHRCPHYMPARPNVTSKQPCVLSEYRGEYKNGPAQRNVKDRPKDLLKSDGDGIYDTTHNDHFLAHKLEGRPQKQTQEKYVRRTDLMDFGTEYGNKYVKGKGETAVMPGYFKAKTKLFDGNYENTDTSVTHHDFEAKQPYGKPYIFNIKDNYVPPDSPFNSKSTHQTDYTKLQQLPSKNARNPDNINNKGLPSYYDTTHNEHFVHHTERPTFYKAKQAPYQPNLNPFNSESTVKTDYKHHKNAPKSEMIKYDNDLFQSNEPLNDETTHTRTYKHWQYQKKNTKRDGEVYRPPSGHMDMQTTSDDFKNFGKDAPASKSARPKTNINFGDEFDGITIYNHGFVKHNVTPHQKNMNRQDYYTSDVPFNNVTESQDKYKRYTTAPATMIRRENEVFDGSVPFASETSYGDQFQGTKLPECPSKKIVASNFAGYKFQDDFDAGHRFLIKIDDQDKNNNKNIRKDSAPFPPIGGNNNIVSVTVR